MAGVPGRAEPRRCATGCCTPPPASRGQRRVFLRLAEHWPWTLALARAFQQLRRIPLLQRLPTPLSASRNGRPVVTNVALADPRTPPSGGGWAITVGINDEGTAPGSSRTSARRPRGWTVYRPTVWMADGRVVTAASARLDAFPRPHRRAGPDGGARRGATARGRPRCRGWRCAGVQVSFPRVASAPASCTRTSSIAQTPSALVTAPHQPPTLVARRGGEYPLTAATWTGGHVAPL